MTLHHAPQTRPYGCLYHATYALTGDPRWLEDEHVNEFSHFHFHVSLHERKLAVFPVYVNNMDDHTPVDLAFWLTMKHRMDTTEGAYPQDLLIAVQSNQHPQLLHAVALWFTLDGVTVSDSLCMDGLQFLPWADFMTSPYARATRIEALIPLDRDSYPREDAAQVMAEKYGVNSDAPKDNA